MFCLTALSEKALSVLRGKTFSPALNGTDKPTSQSMNPWSDLCKAKGCVKYLILLK